MSFYFIFNFVFITPHRRRQIEEQRKCTAAGLSYGNEKRLWHGTSRSCRIGELGQTTACTADDCNVCRIIKGSFDIARANVGMLVAILLFLSEFSCLMTSLFVFLLLGIGLGQEFIPPLYRQRPMRFEGITTQELYGMLYSSIGSWLDAPLIVPLLQSITAPRLDMTQ
jgi:hypothetical protein